MLLVLLVYLLNLIIIFALGSWWQKYIFNDDKSTVKYLLFNGLWLYMLLIWSLLFFTGFNWQWQLTAVILSLLYLIKNSKNLKVYLDTFSTFSKKQKIIFGFFVVVILTLTAGYASVPDNESYYIQTIKWANEQGFVKGLMNVHPFLGQFSGWHILQSGFNFHHLVFNRTFNDLNGLFLIIFSFYWLWQSSKTPSKAYWWHLIPVVSVLFLFFADSPSPDLPIILLSLIIFDLFIRNYNKADENSLIEMFFLALFSFLIKPTGIVNLFLVFILFFKHQKLIAHQRKLIGLIGMFALFLWSGKNYLITGYVFYPFDFFGNILHPKWQYPNSLLTYMSQLGRQESGALNFNGNLPNQFLFWLNQSGIHRIMNLAFVFLLLFYPLILFLKKSKFQNIKAYWTIYFLGVIYFLVLLFFAPNFRFFLAFFVFMGLVIKSSWKLSSYYPVFNLIGIGLFILVGIIFTKKHHFEAKNLLIPQPVSKLSYRFKMQKEQNFKYHYPDNKNLFWETGDAPLPAVHQNEVNYFKEKFGIIPQWDKSKKIYFSGKLSNKSHINPGQTH